MATSESEQTNESARRFATAAGIQIPDDRLALFAASLARNHDLTRSIVVIDYGPTEPASRFRAPGAGA